MPVLMRPYGCGLLSIISTHDPSTLFKISLATVNPLGPEPMIANFRLVWLKWLEN